MSEKSISSNPLEQFVLLAKSIKGAAAVELIKQVLEAPGVYVFGELLDLPNIQELSQGSNAPHLDLLNLFAYGTYRDYRANPVMRDSPYCQQKKVSHDRWSLIAENQSKLPPLTEAQANKLRHLTIVSLATKTKCIPYKVLLDELDVQNLRKLEDLIIEVIYADIIRGKLDQKNQQLEVDFAIGRDIRQEAVPDIINVLQDWCSACEAVLHGIENQISKANQNKENNIKLKQQTEQEIVNVKKTLKTAHPSVSDEQMVTDSRDLPMQSEKPSKKSSKTKGLRGSSGTKLWK